MAVRNSWWSVSNAQTSCSARSHPATWSNRRARRDSSRSPGVPIAPAITAPSKRRCWSRPGTRTAVSGSRRRPTRTRSARSSSSCVRCRGSFSEFDAGESDCAHPNETHLWGGAASTGRRPPRATQFAATEVSPAVADEYRRVVAAAGLGLAASTVEAEKIAPVGGASTQAVDDVFNLVYDPAFHEWRGAGCAATGSPLCRGQ